MLVLPQKEAKPEEQEKRKVFLEKSAKSRTLTNEKGFPPRHSTTPLTEHHIFLDISRQVQINTFRYWITWARIGIYNMFWNSPPTINKHIQSLWLFPKPQIEKILKYPLDDEFFAQQRFCGPQTSLLSQIDQLPEWVPKTEDLLFKLKNRSLFIVDYSVLQNNKIKTGSYFPSVIGLFSCTDDSKYQTEIFLIDKKVIKNESPGLWTYAKACFQVNDAVYFFIINRLCGSFIFLEPIVMHFFRCVHPKHPLYPLFHPLFFGHATSCHWIRKLVLKDDGLIYGLLPLNMDGIEGLVKMAYEHWSFENTNFVQKLTKRGLLNQYGYSYGEDGKDLSDVVQMLISTYVNTCYVNDTDVVSDNELQKWFSETSNPETGNVKGFPNKVETKASLTQVLAHLFFLFLFDRHVIQHAPYDHMAFMPSFPLEILKYADHSIPLTSEEVLHLLFNEQRTLAQLHAIFVFCNEISLTPKWDLKNFPEDLANLMQGADRQFQLKKVMLRDRTKKRPSPFKHFLMHSGFLNKTT